MKEQILSEKLPLAGLRNTRDLGGMHTKNGRIVSGKLIRSGHLYGATPEDLTLLKDRIALIVDFRTEQERAEQPDPLVDSVENLHVPIFESLAAGITQDRKSIDEAFAIVAQSPDLALRYMKNQYVGFVTDAYSIAQYGRFVRLLLAQREKAVLWHCTAGKDRAGFASLLVQELLGVARDDIFADYLQTNEYLQPEIEQICKKIGSAMGGLDEKAQKALNRLFGAKEEYLAGIYQTIGERYGTFEAFLTDGLCITRAEIERLWTLYVQ